MTAQSFDWTNDLHFILSTLQNWGNCVIYNAVIFALLFSHIFCVALYDMKFLTWESNMIALKYILQWIHFYNVV